MQSKEVMAFKNELRNYLVYKERIDSLHELISICYQMLGGLKSPDFQNIPVNSPPNLDRRDKIYAEIDKHRANMERTKQKMEDIENVLNRMPKDIRIATYKVFVQGETIEKIARENGYSKKGMWYWINKEIKKALN